MDEYIEFAVVGFNGQWYYDGYYNGKNYLAMIEENEVVLFSNNRINEKSVTYRNGFETSLAYKDLDDLFRCKMYAIYKGNEYKVQRVGPRLEDLELLMREDFEKEDYELGFEYDFNERTTHKLVNLNDIESIRVEKESVYKDYV